MHHTCLEPEKRRTFDGADTGRRELLAAGIAAALTAAMWAPAGALVRSVPRDRRLFRGAPR